MANPSELATKLPPLIGSKKFFSTRRGTITLAILAALAALGILLLFMSNYRSSVAGGGAQVSVLTADTMIDKGTSGDVIAEAELFKPVSIAEDDVSEGAITDVGALAGTIAEEEIFPGQQLTAAAFTTGADPIAGKLTGTQRAMAVPVHEARGNVGQLEAGSKVDVLGAFNAQSIGGVLSGRSSPRVTTLAQDVMVLKVPPAEGGTASEAEGEQVVLRVTDRQAAHIALAADVGDVWITIRPPTLAEESEVTAAEAAAVLGLGAVPVEGSE